MHEKQITSGLKSLTETETDMLFVKTETNASPIFQHRSVVVRLIKEAGWTDLPLILRYDLFCCNLSFSKKKYIALLPRRLIKSKNDHYNPALLNAIFLSFHNYNICTIN